MKMCSSMTAVMMLLAFPLNSTHSCPLKRPSDIYTQPATARVREFAQRLGATKAEVTFEFGRHAPPGLGLNIWSRFPVLGCVVDMRPP